MTTTEKLLNILRKNYPTYHEYAHQKAAILIFKHFNDYLYPKKTKKRGFKLVKADECVTLNSKQFHRLLKHSGKKKKTDLERFLKLYEIFGIDLNVSKSKCNSEVDVWLEKGDHEKLNGTTDSVITYFSAAVFDKKTGKFLRQEFIN
jgi:hypothetical protein